jgi:hypothetical protein
MSVPLSQSGGGSGGSTAPGGNNTDLQYNNNSAFGGFADGTGTQVLHGGRSFSQVVNADIANTTIDLTAKVTGVLPPANGGVANVNTTAQGFLIGGFVTVPPLAVGSNAVQGANAVYAMQMVVPFIITIKKMAMRLSVVGGAGTKFNSAIYSADGNTKLIETSFDANSTTAQSIATSTVTLNPGTYWFAWSAANATMRAAGYNTSGITEVLQVFLLHGIAANVMASNVMPTTLGAISVSAVAAGVPYTLFYQ